VLKKAMNAVAVRQACLPAGRLTASGIQTPLTLSLSKGAE
jgi:hypothetical protein